MATKIGLLLVLLVVLSVQQNFTGAHYPALNVLDVYKNLRVNPFTPPNFSPAQVSFQSLSVPIRGVKPPIDSLELQCPNYNIIADTWQLLSIKSNDPVDAIGVDPMGYVAELWKNGQSIYQAHGRFAACVINNDATNKVFNASTYFFFNYNHVIVCDFQNPNNYQHQQQKEGYFTFTGFHDCLPARFWPPRS